jgi:transposase
MSVELYNKAIEYIKNAGKTNSNADYEYLVKYARRDFTSQVISNDLHNMILEILEKTKSRPEPKDYTIHYIKGRLDKKKEE